MSEFSEHSLLYEQKRNSIRENAVEAARIVLEASRNTFLADDTGPFLAEVFKALEAVDGR